MKKVVCFLILSIAVLFVCLGVHVSLLQLKDVPYEIKKGDMSALADINIDATFHRDSSDERYVSLNLHKGKITSKTIRDLSDFQENQEDKNYLISYERKFLVNEAAQEAYPDCPTSQLMKDEYVERRAIAEADAQYEFYNVVGKGTIKVGTQHVVSNKKYQLNEVIEYTEEKKVNASYIEFTQKTKKEEDALLHEYDDVLPTESLLKGKQHSYYFMPETNQQFHGENAIYRIRYEQEENHNLNEQQEVKITSVEPITKLSKDRCYYTMVLVNAHPLVISYDAKGYTYLSLYDEKGAFIKETTTKDKLLLQDGTWQNDDYFHFLNGNTLYRLDIHTMQLQKVVDLTSRKASYGHINDVYYQNGKTYVLSLDEEKVTVHVYEEDKLIHEGIWHLGAYEKEKNAYYYLFFDVNIRR